LVPVRVDLSRRSLMSACAWPEEVAPPSFDEASQAAMDAVPFFSAFCPICKAQVIGQDPGEVATDLIAHVGEAHS